ncbi:MAG TPA: hypothetical protein VEH27_12230 [Methylomirabilota bacterium]|nr:hypothetical protein [Methylomirabilota bacterium]
MKATCFLAGLCLLLTAQLSSSVAAETPPSVDAIIEKYISAIGGKAAVEKIKTRVMKMSFEGGGSTGDYTEYGKALRKRAWTLVADWGEISEVVDGEKAWTKNPDGSVREKTGDDLARALREADLHWDINLKSLYPNLTYKKLAKHENSDAHVLESKTTATSVERLYFDVKSGLIVRQEGEFIGSEGSRIKIEMNYSDYKATDGVKFPHTLWMKFGPEGEDGFTFTLKAKELKNNVEVDEAKFKKPTE